MKDGGRAEAEAQDEVEPSRLGRRPPVRGEASLQPPSLLQVAEQRDDPDPQPADRIHDRILSSVKMMTLACAPLRPTSIPLPSLRREASGCAPGSAADREASPVRLDRRTIARSALRRPG